MVGPRDGARVFWSAAVTVARVSEVSLGFACFFFESDALS